MSRSKLSLLTKVQYHLIDARGEVVGRLASQIAPILRGKHKPTFAPNVDCGDHLVIINAADLVLTGDKWEQKLYRWHTGFPGGLKTRTANQIRDGDKPQDILRKAVYGMLPKNKMRPKQMKKLHVFMDDQHSFSEEMLCTDGLEQIVYPTATK